MIKTKIRKFVISPLLVLLILISSMSCFLEVIPKVGALGVTNASSSYTRPLGIALAINSSAKVRQNYSSSSSNSSTQLGLVTSGKYYDVYASNVNSGSSKSYWYLCNVPQSSYSGSYCGWAYYTGLKLATDAGISSTNSSSSGNYHYNRDRMVINLERTRNLGDGQVIHDGNAVTGSGSMYTKAGLYTYNPSAGTRSSNASGSLSSGTYYASKYTMRADDGTLREWYYLPGYGKWVNSSNFSPTSTVKGTYKQSSSSVNNRIGPGAAYANNGSNTNGTTYNYVMAVMNWNEYTDQGTDRLWFRNATNVSGFGSWTTNSRTNRAANYIGNTSTFTFAVSSPGAKVDIWINGSQVGNDVTSYSKTCSYGDVYRVQYVSAVTGYNAPGTTFYTGELTGAKTVTVSASKKTYTVYWKNGSTTLETDTGVTHGTTPTYNGSTPTKSSTAQYSYTFSGWSPAVGAITGNTTYTAQFKATTRTYTVTWKNGSTTLETDTGVAYGTTPTYNGSTPTKASTAQYSYTFSGWSPSVGAITGNTTYTAQFSSTTRSYAVTLSKGTGISAVSGAGTYTYGTTKTIDATVKTGYTWSKWSDGTTTKSRSITVTGAVSLTASATANTYTVAYNGNGNTGGSTASSSHTYDSAKALTSNGFTKTGYTFAGWATSASGSVAYSNGQSVSNLTSTNGATFNLYAKWTANTNTKYVVKHYKEDLNADTYTLADTQNLTGTSDASVTPAVKSYTGFTAPSTQTVTISADGSRVVEYRYTRNSYTVTLTNGTGISATTGNGTYEYGASVTLGATVKTGYTWSKWTGSAESTTKAYNFTMGAGNVSYTANATANTYTVAYNNNGGSGSMSSVSHTYDTAKNLTGNTFAKTGYTFSGWNTAANGTGDSYTDAQSVKNLTSTNGATVTLYAQWTANNYTVVYNANTGEGLMGNVVHTYDSPLNLTANEFTKTGYTFTGWNTATDGTGTSYANEASVVNLTANNGATVTLYAQWSANTYTIVYNANGGTGTIDDQTITYDTTVALTTNTFERQYHNFLGWSTDSSATTPTYTDGQSVTNLLTSGSMTLYAVWEKAGYTVYFDPNGASNTMEEQVIGYGASIALNPNTLVREDYTFQGWSLDNSSNVDLEDEEVVTDLTLESEITIYAVWYYTGPVTIEKSVTDEAGIDISDYYSPDDLFFFSIEADDAENLPVEIEVTDRKGRTSTMNEDNFGDDRYFENDGSAVWFAISSGEVATFDAVGTDYIVSEDLGNQYDYLLNPDEEYASYDLKKDDTKDKFDLEFTSQLTSYPVTFKYYDFAVGEVDLTEYECEVKVSGYDYYYYLDGEFDTVIDNAITYFNATHKNAFHDYTTKSSNKNATDYRYDKFGSKVTANTKDPYWVNYYDEDGNFIDSYDVPDEPIKNPVVWLKSGKHDFLFRAYYPNASDDAQISRYNITDDNTTTTNYVSTRRMTSQYKYYYDIIDSVTTLTEITSTDNNGNPVNLVFSHWSTDPDGTVVLSTNPTLQYKITKDMEVYAVYREETYDEVGASLYANGIDTFSYKQNGDTVNKVRINTMMNGYNMSNSTLALHCDMLTGVYVVADKGVELTNANINTIRKAILAHFEANYDTIKAKGDGGLYSINAAGLGITDSALGVKGANIMVYLDLDYAFTNKNRTNMYVEFNTKTVANRRLLAFSAFGYNDYKNNDELKLVVSSNCLDYQFDANGNATVTSIGAYNSIS